MSIRTRSDHLGVEIGVQPQFLVPASRMVQDFAGMHVQPNKAIVGLNAFRHQSGIHQDGVVKLRETYEIMDPKEVGWVEGSQFVLSKLSGRAGFRSRLEDLGYELDADDFNTAFDRFQSLADTKDGGGRPGSGGDRAGSSGAGGGGVGAGGDLDCDRQCGDADGADHAAFTGGRGALGVGERLGAGGCDLPHAAGDHRDRGHAGGVQREVGHRGSGRAGRRDDPGFGWTTRFTRGARRIRTFWWPARGRT